MRIILDIFYHKYIFFRYSIGEFIGLFASLDSFMVAYVIMCPIGQLEYIFDAAASEFRS